MRSDSSDRPLFRRLRLRNLRAKRDQWVLRRAARKALFSRPTPLADRLRTVANLHRSLDYAYFSFALLIGLKFLWLLSGLPHDWIPYLLLELATAPLLAPFEAHIPSIALSPTQWLEPGHIVALATYGLVFGGINRGVDRVAYRKPF